MVQCIFFIFWRECIAITQFTVWNYFIVCTLSVVRQDDLLRVKFGMSTMLEALRDFCFRELPLLRRVRDICELLIVEKKHQLMKGKYIRFEEQVFRVMSFDGE